MNDSKNYPPLVGKDEDLGVKTFDLKLPLYPGQSETVIKMDGKELKGVTAIVAKAGSNGFTNLVVEFEAKVAMEMVAAFIPKIQQEMGTGKHSMEDSLDAYFGAELINAIRSNGHQVIQTPTEEGLPADLEEVGKAFRQCIEQLMKSL